MTCGFCHGQPVGNAARWISGGTAPTAPCPRCGEQHMTCPTCGEAVVLASTYESNRWVNTERGHATGCAQRRLEDANG